MRPLLTAITIVSVCGSTSGEPPSYPVPRLAAPPTIDGHVRTDSAWRTVPGVTGFRVLGRGYAVAKQSTARIAWTDSALYVAVACEEPDIALIHDKGKDGGALWLDNGVEIFLQLPQNSEVFQFIVNTSGSRVVGAGRDKVELSHWQAAAVKGEGQWSMEAAIPFASLGVVPSPGAKWRGAVCRNIWEYKSGGDKFTCWPALRECFREPESFAVLELCDDSRDAEQVARGLNAPYRQHLIQQIEGLARTGREYGAPIARAAGHAAFADEARELAATWRRVAALSGEPAKAPLPEVRELIATASDLKRRSYEVKYRFLIEQLLESE